MNIHKHPSRLCWAVKDSSYFTKHGAAVRLAKKPRRALNTKPDGKNYLLT